MGQVTENTCRYIIEYADRDERFPLTVNEMRQLAYLAQKHIEAARRTTPDRGCEWKCDDVDNGTWESCCGEIWTFTEGGPIENGMLFCHRCGSKLKTAPNGEKG